MKEREAPASVVEPRVGGLVGGSHVLGCFGLSRLFGLFVFLGSRIFCVVLFVLIVRIVQVLMFLVTGLFLNVVFTGLFGRVYVVDLLSVFLFGVVRTVCLSGMSGFVVGLFGHFGLL